MKIPWCKRDPSHVDHLKAELKKKYPDLRVIVQGDLVFLIGSFPILHDGIELDRFQIMVQIAGNFPESIPIVRETGGRVPNSPDWHTYDKGALCVMVPEEWLANPESGSIMAFLDGPVRNYFLGHTLAESGLQRPMGERSHGSRGLLEAYGEMVGSAEPISIRKYLAFLSKDRVKGHWDCPCGSGNKLRKCHMNHFLNLQKKISSKIARMALKRLEDYDAGKSSAADLK
jgi:hypothetical protein